MKPYWLCVCVAAALATGVRADEIEINGKIFSNAEVRVDADGVLVKSPEEVLQFGFVELKGQEQEPLPAYATDKERSKAEEIQQIALDRALSIRVVIENSTPDGLVARGVMLTRQTNTVVILNLPQRGRDGSLSAYRIKEDAVGPILITGLPVAVAVGGEWMGKVFYVGERRGMPWYAVSVRRAVELGMAEAARWSHGGRRLGAGFIHGLTLPLRLFGAFDLALAPAEYRDTTYWLGVFPGAAFLLLILAVVADRIINRRR